MSDLLPFFVWGWLVGSVLLAATCWWTRQIQRSWLRQIPRAIIAGFAFAAIPISMGHGPPFWCPIWLTLWTSAIRHDLAALLAQVALLLVPASMVFWLLALSLSVVKRALIKKREMDA